METFDDFLACIDEPVRRVRTKEVLDWVSATFPGLKTRIAWNQPMFTDHGTFIIGFSAAKHHMAAAPERACIQRFSGEIRAAGLEHTLELVRFPWDKPVDYPLLERMIRFNIADKASCASFWRK